MSPNKPTKFQANNSELRQPKMSHIRTIKPEYFVHEGVNEMSVAARLMLPGIWTCCDKHGRFEWKPKTLKLKILPFDVLDFEALMLEAVAGGFITRYEVGGQKYGLCMNWTKHQGIGTREKDSKFEYPAPPKPEPPSPSDKAAPVLHSADTVPAQDTHSAASVGVGVDLGVGVGKEIGVGESTLQPNALVGGSVGAPQDLPSAEPTPKSAGNEKSLWAQLHKAYQEVYDTNPALAVNELPEPMHLPKQGVDTLEGVLSGLALAGVSLSDVIAGWKVFVREKYAANGPWSDAPIKMPVAFFAADVIGFYVEQAKREAAQEAERARTVQTPSGKSAADIATEIFDNNLV
jgi:hypothetical protein